MESVFEAFRYGDASKEEETPSTLAPVAAQVEAFHNRATHPNNILWGQVKSSFSGDRSNLLGPTSSGDRSNSHRLIFLASSFVHPRNPLQAGCSLPISSSSPSRPFPGQLKALGTGQLRSCCVRRGTWRSAVPTGSWGGWGQVKLRRSMTSC
jgi:hypothetical protein